MMSYESVDYATGGYTSASAECECLLCRDVQRYYFRMYAYNDHIEVFTCVECGGKLKRNPKGIWY